MKSGRYAGRLRKRFAFSREDENSFGFQPLSMDEVKRVTDKIVESATKRGQMSNTFERVDLDSIMLRADQAGEVVGLTGMRIRQLAQEGYITRVGKEYPLLSVVKGYIAFMKKEEQRPTKAAADAKIRELRAKEIEQRMAEKAKALIAIDDVNAELSTFVANVRAEIVAIPARLTRDKEQRRQYESVVNDILKRIADRQSKAAEALRADGDTDDAITEDAA